ncbi:hypothetical protein [Shewanella litorisediminis]|uniref:Extradiol ring-cleavage dioxygenase LigAB LigA subunit domain-containing protein n=1 Tax=Shewanella litorisediminis TaxID=1173586 RepID=A0ABX7G006_9GAMM|nr:hypothetical protein [Shewanella litorisediminis]MCL2918296.1 hypothetical protein [Shewanella litorisediminis]QRH00655.1 hypothetical protein JQC75_12280 [Shewanella litorisediminis]
MSKLTDFLKQLGEDAALLEAYKKDPEGVMRQHGLSEDEIQAIMSGDKAKLKAFGGEEQYQSLVVIYNGNDA